MRRLKHLEDRITRVEHQLGDDAAVRAIRAKPLSELTADEIITLLCAATKRYGLERVVAEGYRLAETVH